MSVAEYWFEYFLLLVISIEAEPGVPVQKDGPRKDLSLLEHKGGLRIAIAGYRQVCLTLMLYFL